MVSSAGIVAKDQEPYAATINELNKLKISLNGYKQKRLTRKLALSQDIIIAMAIQHQKFIKNKYNLNSVLFNEVAIGKKTSVLDINQTISNYTKDIDSVNKYIVKTVDYIHGITPKMYEHLIKMMVKKSSNIVQ